LYLIAKGGVVFMEQMFLSTALEFKEINTFEPGAWINLVNPSQEESVSLAEQFNIDITDLRAPLDLEETSRISVEDDYTLIIVDVPTYEERNNKSYYVTIPLGIIVTDNAVITTCLQELTLFDNFFNRRVKNFYTFMKTRFVFQLLYRNAELFLTALRSIDRQSDRIEAELENATRNEQLIDMMELEKSIVYLKASLKFNERIVKKLSSSTSSLKKYIEDEDLLEDTLIETQQAIEMAGIYENVLNAMTETTASIINNNQNTIMKTLALMTMALDIPTVIFSAYGMNFQNNWLPLNGLPHAFWYIVFIAAAMSLSVVFYFFRKKWF
jgi:magnesium transporter